MVRRPAAAAGFCREGLLLHAVSDPRERRRGLLAGQQIFGIRSAWAQDLADIKTVLVLCSRIARDEDHGSTIAVARMRNRIGAMVTSIGDDWGGGVKSLFFSPLA